tara:strand:+ start:3667 stop:3879 length:213 start_codon:yes stop_codon:yes gene_type:complete
MTSNTPRRALQWTTIVMGALADAKNNPDKMINIEVAKEESAIVVEQAIMALMAQGEMAAFRLVVDLKTLH